MRSKMKLYICHLIKFTPESGKQGESYMEVVIKFKKQKNLEKQTFNICVCHFKVLFYGNSFIINFIVNQNKLLLLCPGSLTL